MPKKKYFVSLDSEERQQLEALISLNTHVAHALYKAFAPAEARRILERPEFHYTPKQHRSWLNMAEIEFSVLAKQC